MTVTLTTPTRPDETATKRTKGERTKQRIRDGVKTLLTQMDLNDIGIEDVVEETEIPVGSIYFHFKNKDYLMRAVAEDSIRQFFRSLATIEDEEVFGAFFLYCWRCTEQYSNTRGHTQLLRWYLQKFSDEPEALWAQERSSLVQRLVGLALKAQAVNGDPDEVAVLIDILMTGTEQILIADADLKATSPKARRKQSTAVAKRFATSWYKAVMGPQATPPATHKDAIKRISQSKIPLA